MPGAMTGPLLLFGLPMWIVIAVALVIAAILVFAILKRLFKLALIVAAVVAGIWLAQQLIG